MKLSREGKVLKEEKKQAYRVLGWKTEGGRKNERKNLRPRSKVGRLRMNPKAYNYKGQNHDIHREGTTSRKETLKSLRWGESRGFDHYFQAVWSNHARRDSSI